MCEKFKTLLLCFLIFGLFPQIQSFGRKSILLASSSLTSKKFGNGESYFLEQTAAKRHLDLHFCICPSEVVSVISQCSLHDC